MAERRGGREARLAGVDVAAIFGGEPRQIEQFRLYIRLPKNLIGNINKPIALRHLARAGMLGARGAIDEKDAQRPGRILLPLLGFRNRPARRDPVGGEIVVGIGISGPGLLRMRRLAGMRVGVPGRLGDLFQLGRQRIESLVLELRAKAPLEFLLAKPRAGHPLARLRRRAKCLQKINHAVTAILAKLRKAGRLVAGSGRVRSQGRAADCQGRGRSAPH